MSVTLIDAKTKISSLDQHGKVYAGPGAGKTTWLINHMKSVLNKSERLGKTRKIACITYTNVGAETVVRRLGRTADRIEVSTIHSFLYKHIVKPYVHLLADEYNLAYKKLDGHDDTVLSNYKFISEWKALTNQQRIGPNDHPTVVEAWRKLGWKFENATDLVIKTPYPFQVGRYPIKTSSYLEYKKMMWAKGLLHHEDVLFFSWELVKRFPFLLTVIRAKFPYFFIDEFQDTHPIQSKLLQKIAEVETTVVVIGDQAQSIYSFLGADPINFTSFQLPGLQEYQMYHNYRSTDVIVNLLNKIRTDIQQIAQRQEPGQAVKVIIGDKAKAVEKAKTLIGNEDLVCLSHDNLTANILRKSIDKSAAKEDLIEELIKRDSNRVRCSAIVSCIKAIEYARQGYFKDALKALKYFPGVKGTSFEAKRKSLQLLKQFLDDIDELEQGMLTHVLHYLNRHGCGLPTLAKGAIKDFYENCPFQHISIAVKNLDESGPFRTIHKAKGDEFNNVLLVLDYDNKGNFNESKNLAFLFKPSLVTDEEHRVKYVGLSRARNHLFINVPVLSIGNRQSLTALGFEVLDVSTNSTSLNN